MLVLSEKKIENNTGIDIVNFPTGELQSYNGNADVCAIVCSRATAVKAEKMDFPNLKLIQLTSAGFDNVPINEYKNRGIAVANAGTVYSTPISETIVYGILSMAKKYNKNPNNHHIRLTRGYDRFITELKDKKILIMGAGSIGTHTAKKLYSFDMQISGYDPYCPEKEPYLVIYRTREEIIKNIGDFDFVLSTMPDTDETKKFINSELFSNMKSSAIFVNVGRRAVINEDDLYSALKSKQIGGADLDMFEKLPNPITNRFRRLKNTIVWPGVSAISKEVNSRLSEHILSNIKLLREGKNPDNIINGVVLFD